LLARDRDAVSDALNRIDDARPGQREKALELLGALERALRFPGPPRVGLTGAPGVGKSSLLDAIVRALRARDETLGIVAVDPSSRRTGGALLGDRVRVRSSSSDPGVFLRSMAARGRLGGVADATRASVIVLAAAFDWVFVETVGVGQSETDVAMLVDTLVYVAQPGAGDLLQFMKAGILELPDVFVVNKADLGAAAARTAAELEAGLGLGFRDAASGWTPPILLVSARDGSGVPDLVETLRAHRRHLESGSTLEARRGRGKEAFVLEALERRYGSYGSAQLGGPAGIASRVREARDTSAFSLVLALGREIEDSFRKPVP
jgi:LAO/AO transport system kinase